jgi:hypothetical protein
MLSQGSREDFYEGRRRFALIRADIASVGCVPRDEHHIAGPA